MTYENIGPADFFTTLQSEERARDWLWRAKCDGQEFVCPCCQGQTFYELRSRPEVRKCRCCRRQVRLRADTMLERSKLHVRGVASNDLSDDARQAWCFGAAAQA